MKPAEEVLVERILERVADPARWVDLPATANKAHLHRVPAAVSPAEVELAEQQLGFPLPALLRALYLQVGNGGFGPGYGLLRLNERGARNYHSSLVDAYLQARRFTHPDYPAWPPRFITVCDWGDNITSVLDWTAPLSSIHRFHGDRYRQGPFESAIEPEFPALQTWLEDWLDGRPLFENRRRN